MITIYDLLEIGFKPIPHFTVQNNFTYNLGRCRELSIGSVGTPNENLWITSHDDEDFRKITDLVCLHNFDYDGYITIEKIKGIINLIEDKNINN